MSEEKFDLHGVKGQPFPSFDEYWSYLERVTIINRAEAQKALATESGMNAEEHDPQPIHMRHAEGGELTEHSEFGEGWFECEPDHPNAVPFWKDAP